ncbi:hypothetical protein PoB_006058300 [Plakobranchus ocellatus]|uniref:Uncharacterized protein n=1 Tax=Plakobranchus ocellatus TaxID=259542 RepID=A0AAV4CQB1_9GAST|nr:hypothetical protein PoB_006058300 [Plakobranchus ocellatus]
MATVSRVMRGHVMAPPFPLSNRAADVTPGCKTQRIAPTLRQVADLVCARTKETEYFQTCIVGHILSFSRIAVIRLDKKAYTANAVLMNVLIFIGRSMFEWGDSSSGRAVGYQVRGPSFESQSRPSQFFNAPLCPSSTKWVARSLKTRRK